MTSECDCAGEQLQAALAGLVLLEVALPRAWERVVRLRFGPRLSDPPSAALWLEVMGRCAPLPPHSRLAE